MLRECAARAMIAAVTPLPHVATTGWVKSTPDLWNSRDRDGERGREREEGGYHFAYINMNTFSEVSIPPMQRLA